MSAGIAIALTIVYGTWCGLDVLLRDVLRPPNRDRATAEFTRKYRKLYHTAAFLMYLLAVGGGIVGFGQLEYYAGIMGIFIFGVVGLIWIKEPSASSDQCRRSDPDDAEGESGSRT